MMCTLLDNRKRTLTSSDGKEEKEKKSLKRF